ncbi:MAG TPA: acyl transferase [Bacteroides sp.]|nr:acyl transferase [Bacteroides sp.]
MEPALPQAIFQIDTEQTFRSAALEVFRFQSAHNPVYREYLARLGVDARGIGKIEDIPFLPVEFFRTRRVICSNTDPEIIFESSGTTMSAPSRHYVSDASLYRRSITEGFRTFYGAADRYCILALLPSYLERGGSSLVFMMDHLIRLSGHPDSGFYLDQLDDLAAVLRKRAADGHPTLLLGVSFALLDLAEKYPLTLGDPIIVMETGGMKGQRKELVRSELHSLLTVAFGTGSIHSEYGMTELLSQAYSQGGGLFRSPSWMKVLVRDPNDPLTILEPVGEKDPGPGTAMASASGGLNMIDLANLHSCAFIATGDLGRVYRDGSFEVTGRFDHADVRGCNLLVP